MIHELWLRVTARARLYPLAYPSWWRWRKRWHRWNVQRSRWIQAQSSRVDGHRRNFTVAFDLTRKTASIAVTAGVLLFMTEIASVLMPHVGWSPLRHLTVTLESKDYGSLASVLIGAEATLLALYYATVGVVASTAYSAVPGDIRKLFIHQRISNVYTHGIVRALVFTIILFGLGSLGYHIRALSLIVAVLLAVFAVLRLAVVSIAPFGFFDPAALTLQLPDRFRRALTRATTLPTALDEGSQKQAHADAAETLNLYRQITDLVATRPIRNSAAPLNVARQLLSLSFRYASLKNLIPSDSAWWSSVSRYPTGLPSALIRPTSHWRFPPEPLQRRAQIDYGWSANVPPTSPR